MGSSEAEVPGSNGLRAVGSVVVMGSKGVLGRRPLPDAVDADEEEEGRPPPRMVRRMWLKLLLAFEVDEEDEAALAAAAALAGSVCGAAVGERSRLGSMVVAALDRCRCV